MVTRRVIGSWRVLRPDGSRVPGQGTITFKPSVLIRDSNTNQIVVQDPIIVTLSTQGTIDVQLQTTDQPGLNPTGWHWDVTEEITSLTVRRYQLELPAGGTFDLSAVEVPPTAVPLRPQDQYLKRLEIGPTTVLNPNQSPSVDQTTTNSVAELQFDLPRAPNVAIGNVTTGTPVQGPDASSSTTAQGDARFNFRLPRSRNVEAGTTSMVNPDQPANLSTAEDGNGDLTLNLSVPRAAEVTVGTVTESSPDSTPAVSSTVTDGDVALNFDLPRAAEVTLGATTVVNPDELPDVISTTTDGDVELSFDLPRAADVSLGTVTAVDNDQLPAITDSGTDGDVVLDVNLPKAKTLDLGTVTVVNPDVNPAISDSGDVNSAVFDVSIPRAAAVTVDTPATVVAADVDPSVASTTTDGDVEIAFTLPRAAEVTVATPATVLNPDQQPAVSSTTTDGDVEIAFSLPAAPTFAVGTVTTVGPSETADATDVGTDGNIVIDFDLPRGEKGWAPVLNVVTDGARRVLQVDDWTGGEGTKPATGDYIGATGLVSDIALAVDIRGEQGPSGTGSLDNLSDVIITDVADGDFIRYDTASGNWLNTGVDTDSVDEGATNLYYTDARVESVIAGSTTDDLDEGVTNLYYTDARAEAAADGRIAAATTDDLTEGASNLYFTDQRADDRIAAASIDDLADVDTTAAAASNLLQYDGADWKAVAQEEVNGNVYYRVKNASSTPISRGTVLGFAGTVGASGLLLVAPADLSVISEDYVVGLASDDLAGEAEGFATHFGQVRDLDTSAFSDGDVLWVDPATPGGLTATEPALPRVLIAAVVRSNATTGILQVRVAVEHALDTDDVTEAGNLYFTDQRADDRIAAASIDDLADVDVSAATTGDVLAYDGSDWVPDSTAVRSEDVSNIETITQANYDLLSPPDPNTLYIVI